MSLTQEELGKSKLPTLTNYNFTTWIEYIKDYILALEHEDAFDIWEHYEWVATPNNNQDPIDFDWQQANNAATKKLRMCHNKAFRFIRQSLIPEIFDTTLRLPVSVPKLNFKAFTLFVE